MDGLTIDHCIVYGSIFLILLVGLFAGKGVRTIQSYAVADKMFSTTSLIFTYLATNLAGASIVNVTAMIFSDGIIVTVALLGLVVTFTIQALFIAPHAVYFSHCMTMGDMMASLYGRMSGVLAGVLGLLGSLFLAGMELIVLGVICSSLLGIPSQYAILVGGIILTLYAAHGGIKSVVTTDVLQFLMVVVGVPLIAYVAVNKVGGISELFQKVPQEKWTILGHPKFGLYLTLFLLWTIFPAGMIDSAIIQRLLMGKTKQQLRNQYLVVAFFDPMFQLLVLLIALSGIVLYPGEPGSDIVPNIINHFAPVGLKGIAIAGLLAIVMSTVDSHLHVTGVILVHDMIKPAYLAMNKPLSPEKEKHFAQLATLFVGISAIGIGLSTTDMFGLLLSSLAATGPILMFPLLSGMMGLKPEKTAFYLAMACTCICWAMCQWCLPSDYSYLTTLLSIITNGIAFFATHFWINKKFKRAHRELDHFLSDYSPPISLLKMLSPGRLFGYVKQQMSQELPYMLAAFFCLLNLLVPHFLWDQMVKMHTKCLVVIYIIGALLCVLLITKEKWSRQIQKKYFPILFYLTLLYCLPFTSTLMVIISQGDSSWFANIFLSLTLLIVLVEGMIVLLSFLGMGLSLLFYPHFGPIDWAWHTTSISLVIYQVGLALFLGALFSCRRKSKIIEMERQQIQLMQAHERREVDYLHSLQYQSLYKNQLSMQRQPMALTRQALKTLAQKAPEAQHLIQQGLDQLDGFLDYCQSSLYYSMDAVRLKISSISISGFLEQIHGHLKDPEVSARVRVKLLTHQKMISCDVDKVVQLLVDNISSLLEAGLPGQVVILTISDTELRYHFQAIEDQNYSRKMNALAFLLTNESDHLPPIASNYVGTTLPLPLPVPKSAAELVNRNHIQLIDAHYGHYKREDQPNYRLSILPVNVALIRSRIVDRSPLPADAPLDNEESKALEVSFLNQLRDSACSLEGSIVADALELIKWAHKGQLRKSGSLYYTHPLTVATILLKMTQLPDAILAALFHDLVEDTPVCLEQLTYQYGKQVAWMVQKVTNLDPTGKKTKLTQSENLHHFSASSNDHVLMIKLADRLHNVRTLKFHSPEKQRAIAQETVDHYLPLFQTLSNPAVDSFVQELTLRCQACGL